MLTMEWFFGDQKLADAHAVRRAVFIEEQGIDEEVELDNTDSACIHLVAYDHDAPVGTGRIMITRDDYIIGRVAVLKSHRGRRLGRAIMQTLIQACCIMGGERQILHAQVHVRPFYEKLGFNAYGEEFEEAGITHIAMEHFGRASCCASQALPGGAAGS